MTKLPLKHNKILASVIASTLAAAVGAPTAVWAQSAEATLRGKAAPSAKVTAKNVATGSVRSTTAAADGTYVLVGLTPGVYRVDAGANTEHVVTLNVATTATLDLTSGAVAAAGNLEDVDVRALIEATFGKLAGSLDNPPYNLVLDSAPLREKVDATYHWHWEIHPRLREIAGLELGTGLPVIAAALAQRTHAPNLLIVFEAGGVGPQIPVLPISVGDSRTCPRWSSVKVVGLLPLSMAAPIAGVCEVPTPAMIFAIRLPPSRLCSASHSASGLRRPSWRHNPFQSCRSFVTP